MQSIIFLDKPIISNNDNNNIIWVVQCSLSLYNNNNNMYIFKTLINDR